MANADYSGVPATVDFQSGDTEKSFTFTAVQDSEDEEAETLTLGFGTMPESVSAGTTSSVLITIFDSIHVSFVSDAYEAYEGGPDALVTVHLDRAADMETVIPITAMTLNGTTPADWSGVPASLTFAAGEDSKSFNLVAFDDDVEDDGEMLELGLGILPAGVAAGMPDSAVVTLMNDDLPEVEPTTYGCPENQ